MTELNPRAILVRELKKAGLNVGEEAAKQLLKAVFAAIPKFVLATENKVDDTLIAILPVIEPYILSLLDSIDKEQDETLPEVPEVEESEAE